MEESVFKVGELIRFDLEVARNARGYSSSATAESLLNSSTTMWQGPIIGALAKGEPVELVVTRCPKGTSPNTVIEVSGKVGTYTKVFSAYANIFVSTGKIKKGKKVKVVGVERMTTFTAAVIFIQ